MDYGLIILVLTGALVDVTFAQTRQYYFVNELLSWNDSQNYCRSFLTDLATIENTDDVDAILSTASDFTGKAWIGLYDDLINSWRWSLNDSSFYGKGQTEFRNWHNDSDQPNNLGGQQYCVELLSGSHLGKWGDTECSEQRHFVCYNGTVNGISSFIKVNTSLNWTDAQTFCRENYVDLASIRNQTENDIITNLANGEFVWIGLHREKVWSDGSTSLFRHWAARQPNSGTLRCVTTLFNDSGLWSTEDCATTLPFICYTRIFSSTGQNETSITLQWNKVNNDTSFILQFNGTEINISAPGEDGPVTHTVSSLTAGSQYNFTLLSVFENVRSSGITITAVTAPPNAESFTSTGQNETSITLQWNKVNNDTSFILRFNGTEINISAPGEDGPVTHTVSSLTAGTQYNFTLWSVFENVRSSGITITAVTAPPNAESFTSTRQNENSITLQWNKVNNDTSFILQFNGTEINISAPGEDGPVTRTVSSLTAGTRYSFTLLSVFENVRSSGTTTTAVTAPPNTDSLISTGQNQTSVTLQWNKVNNDTSFILQFNGTEINISAPDGAGPVIHTVSSLTAATKYTFTLLSVFENVRSSGITITAVTGGPHYVVGLNVRLKSFIQLSGSDIQTMLEELFRQYGLSSQLLSLKVDQM